MDSAGESGSRLQPCADGREEQDRCCRRVCLQRAKRAEEGERGGGPSDKSTFAEGHPLREREGHASGHRGGARVEQRLRIEVPLLTRIVIALDRYLKLFERAEGGGDGSVCD